MDKAVRRVLSDILAVKSEVKDEDIEQKCVKFVEDITNSRHDASKSNLLFITLYKTVNRLKNLGRDQLVEICVARLRPYIKIAKRFDNDSKHYNYIIFNNNKVETNQKIYYIMREILQIQYYKLGWYMHLKFKPGQCPLFAIKTFFSMCMEFHTYDEQEPLELHNAWNGWRPRLYYPPLLAPGVEIPCHDVKKGYSSPHEYDDERDMPKEYFTCYLE